MAKQAKKSKKGGKAAADDKNERIIADNRKAGHNYHVTDTLECGIVLVGSAMFTSLKTSRRHLGFSYVVPKHVAASLRDADENANASLGDTRLHGFTLVELLVVITIIGTLVALLLPAVLASKEAARRGHCFNNMRNVAQAMAAYETSKGQLPGYSQGILRGTNRAVGIKHTTNPARWVLITVPIEEALPVSWAAKLLPQIDRQDVWDQIVDVNSELEIRRIDIFICPSDHDAIAGAEVPALTYSVNAGAPDWDGRFLIDPKNPNVGDTPDNGMFLNLYEYAALKMKLPATRFSNIRDGSATTIMLAENVHKSYEPAGPDFPSRFSWAFGTEQHLGIVWVVSDRPQPGDTYVDQERMNHVSDDVYDNDPVFDPNWPRFARPASNHVSGANIAFCDAHTEFLRDDIDYVVYQQLLTTNGKKCVDPRDHDAGVKPPVPAHPIYKFRKASPLSEQDYR